MNLAQQQRTCYTTPIPTHAPSFDVSPGAALAGGTTGRVLRLTAYLGDKVFETFPVDVVVTHTMTAEPDVTPPIDLVRRLVDPILDGQATRQWNPDTLRWDG
jgi:hypothetical protein